MTSHDTGYKLEEALMLDDKDRVMSICGFGNNLKPKHVRKLYSHNIVQGHGSEINKTCAFRLSGCGIAWTELTITSTGDTNCTPDLKIVVMTDHVLQSFDVNGYDTCPTCNGAGVLKHGYRGYED